MTIGTAAERVGCIAVALVVLASSGRAAWPGRPPVEVLHASGGLPAFMVGQFEEPLAFAQAVTGEYLVLDRRGHTIWKIDQARRQLVKLVEAGIKSGEVLSPGALAVGPSDVFAVADAPNTVQRVQIFSLDGTQLTTFALREPLRPRLTVGPLVLNGVGSLQFGDGSFLVNEPVSGGLITEVDWTGDPLRTIGPLRATGHEDDRDLQLALNIGLPLVDPTGGFFFVFQTGIPMFRKYDGDGHLVFERHIEGPEIDALVQGLPDVWPRQPDRLPLVLPMVRTAAVDPAGRLWVSLAVPFTYVYDARGEKVRTVQFEAAGVLSPTSLFFPSADRLLVTPGCYEFRSADPAAPAWPAGPAG